MLFYLLYSFDWAFHLAALARVISYSLLEVTATTFNSQYLADRLRIAYRYNMLETILEQAMISLSDAIVIWRAWVLSYDNQWAIIAPCALLLGAVGFSSIALIYSSYVKYIISIKLSHSIGNRLYYISRSLSIAANAAATLVIFYKLWEHQRFRRELGLKRSRVTKVLFVLVESGLVFLALQSTSLIMSFITAEGTVSTASAYVAQAFLCLIKTFIAAYPSMVVYLVGQQHDIDEIDGIAGNQQSGLAMKTNLTFNRLSGTRTLIIMGNDPEWSHSTTSSSRDS
ncbi:hypothetical protein DXG01_000653 [Tephrocybe rancida]|nr:hypothetical protein DXG01_000653 [Tephrocybe rancida]